jgi:hypothetical protein
MSETQTANVFRQPGSYLPIGEEPVVLFRHPAPGTQVYLVDGHGPIQGIELGAAGHPATVSPGIIQVPDDGGGPGWAFGGKGKGIGFVHPVTSES